MVLSDLKNPHCRFSLLIVLVVWFLAEMAMLPGKIARKRKHPQAEAISVAGWLGLLMTLGVLWALAVVWAHTLPASQSGSRESV